MAIATNTEGQTFLYAADGGPNRAVDMYNGTFAFVKSFSDPKIPKDFTTYGIQAINGEIWVTFTALNKAQGGFVDVFATDGTVLFATTRSMDRCTRPRALLGRAGICPLR